MNSRRLRLPAALLLVVALVLAACGGGDDDDESTDDTETTTTETTTTTTAPTTTTTAPPPVFPLTGLPVVDTTALARPALAVKIDNVRQAHPQMGINYADVVYEELVEGSATRLMAIFQSTDAGPIGPVRSARTTDVPIFSALNRPLFAWSGGNDWVRDALSVANMVDVGHTPASDQYYRAGGRAAPHNLFIQGYVAMLASHQADAGSPPPLFAHRAAGEPLGAGARPIGSVHIVYGGGGGNAPVDYGWDSTIGGWLRWQAGVPHVDTDGVQVAPENLVIQFVDYIEFAPGFPEGQLVGQGPAWVLTAGHIVDATWSKASPDAVTQYVDSAGAPIKLTPGNTWVSLAPPGGATITA